MDINGGGIFSTDLISELSTDCSQILLGDGAGTFFNEDGTTFYPWHFNAGFKVEDGVSLSDCSWISNVNQVYDLKELTIEFIFIGDNREIDEDDLILTGTLSDDNTTSVTSYNPSVMHGNFYSGDFILTLELQE
jgi:hypothetical protein